MSAVCMCVFIFLYQWYVWLQFKLDEKNRIPMTFIVLQPAINNSSLAKKQVLK